MDIEIGRIGVEGPNGLGRQLTQFLMQSGFDVREVQSNRKAERRRRRQKTDREDAEAIAQDFAECECSDGKTAKEARRAHKRQLANRVIRRMWDDRQRQVNKSRTGLQKAA